MALIIEAQQEKVKYFSKMESDKCQRKSTVDTHTEAESASKNPKNKKIKKREAHYVQNKVFKEEAKKFYRKLGTKNIETREPPSVAEVKPC
jgi:hypothetical protein